MALGFGGACWCLRGRETKLVGKDAGLDLFHVTLFQIAKLEGAVGNADQTADLMAKMLHDPAHFTVLALADGDAEPGIAGHLPVEPRVDLAIAHTFDGDAAGERRQRLWVDMALNPYAVFP